MIEKLKTLSLLFGGNSVKNNFKLGIMNTTVVPIMKLPDMKSEMADEGLFGMVVKVLEDIGDGWYYIETHYKYNGYVHKDNMIMDDKRAVEWRNIANSVIIHSVVDVMAKPYYQSYIVETLVRGAIVFATKKEDNGWVEVELHDNRRGWIRSPFVGSLKTTFDKNNEDTLRKNLIETALSYIGTQYRWGGKSPLGIDCSGLCSISYLLNGVIIYRDAVLKDEYMRKISINDIKPADLIFFPGHVAMYIGDDKYVHSSSSINGVGINSLNPSHSDYREDLAKKIIGIGTIFYNN